ncbi:hypothetical protein AUC70_08530 [Methyloceanibacter stevinii]|uniref:Uncharacterized protein n=1 Tax=Methyloceanibacter stevinii TaxID=1774970 RepID=A0A1E3VMB0_9HYPH|nr:hypothetical protein [Methyloceanibacter stevinii]ODR94653.1 hypothetical protein AUC70_08530 [Methyloceanibacter stevinii]
MAPRILDASIEAETARRPLQGPPKDEHAFVAAGPVHFRLHGPVRLRCLVDFLIERDQFGIVAAAAAGRIQFLLQLHAADILLGLGEAVASERQAAERQRAQAGNSPRCKGRRMRRAWRENTPKTAMDPHDGQSNPWGNLNCTLCAQRIFGQCGMNKMVCLTIWRFAAISGTKMMYPQSNLSISGCIIPR